MRMHTQTGRQEIKCRVTSCMHNQAGEDCALTSIDVEPGMNVSSGDPTDESMCASYDSKG